MKEDNDAKGKIEKEKVGGNDANSGETEKTKETKPGCPEGCVAVEDYKRLAADFDNYRKRAESVAQDGRTRGKMFVASDLLALLDDFDSAIGHYEKNEEVKAGLAGLRKRLFDTLKAHGLEEIGSCEGKKFDPEVCEAVRTDEKAEEGIVSCELRKGYSFCGQVIRHPMVVVGCGKAKEENGK
jgi:molecular chaperone GrpE